MKQKTSRATEPKSTIIDIRGTNGSGKSWIVHQLLNKYGHEVIYEDGQDTTEWSAKLGKQIGVYMPKIDAAAIGRYWFTCGGCDGIKKPEEMVRRVRKFAAKYRYVFVEGLLVSHAYKRYATLASELLADGYEYKFLFLDTPLKTCIKRVEDRRKAKGKLAPLDPKYLVADYYKIWDVVRGKCYAAGYDVIELDHKNPMPAVLKLLK